MQTWRPATSAAEVKDFEQLVGPNQHNLPVNVKPLGCFFLFLPSKFSQIRLQKQTDTPNTRSLPDTKQKEIPADELKAYLSILIMTSVSQKPRIECNHPADRNSVITGSVVKCQR